MRPSSSSPIPKLKSTKKKKRREGKKKKKKREGKKKKKRREGGKTEREKNLKQRLLCLVLINRVCVFFQLLCVWVFWNPQEQFLPISNTLSGTFSIHAPAADFSPGLQIHHWGLGEKRLVRLCRIACFWPAFLYRSYVLFHFLLCAPPVVECCQSR